MHACPYCFAEYRERVVALRCARSCGAELDEPE